MTIITAANAALPRDLDVTVNVSRVQVESATDLSTTVALVNATPSDSPIDRVRFFSSLAAVNAVFPVNSEASRMAQAFFSQSPRAATLAIGLVFDDPQAGFFSGNVIAAAVSDFAAVTDGSFTITIDGDTQSITGVSFTGATSFDDVASGIQTALQLVGTGGYAGATVNITDDNRLEITSGTTGDSSSVSVLSSSNVGTDLSDVSFLNAQSGTTVAGFTPGGLVAEADNIRQTANASGQFIYGYALERSYRDTQEQIDFSAFIEAQTAITFLLSNSQDALNPAVTTDIGSVISGAGRSHSVLFWSSVADQYKDVAALARALSVDYGGVNTVETLKFKDLAGISASDINETQLNTLESKGFNVLTRVGNTARTLREGVTASPLFFVDDRILLDNFREEVQTAVFNLFLRERKVPYTTQGATLVQQAIREVCDRYVTNGGIAPRPVADATRDNGEAILPAFQINFTPLRLVSSSDRANRIGPPFSVILQLSGAIHSVTINVEAFV